jgi:hypothetical protein
MLFGNPLVFTIYVGVESKYLHDTTNLNKNVDNYKCPFCGSPIQATNKGYICSAKHCKFAIDYITPHSCCKVSLEKVEKVQPEPKPKLICPICGEKVKDTGRYYICTNYKSPCSFIVPHKLFEAEITKDDLLKLLNGETVEKEFTWKSGKKSRKPLILEDGRAKIIFD